MVTKGAVTKGTVAGLCTPTADMVTKGTATDLRTLSEGKGLKAW